MEQGFGQSEEASSQGKEAQALLRLFFIGSRLRKARLRSRQVRQDSSGTGNVTSESLGSVPTVGVEEMHLDRMTSSQVQYIMCGIISEKQLNF